MDPLVALNSRVSSIKTALLAASMLTSFFTLSTANAGTLRPEEATAGGQHALQAVKKPMPVPMPPQIESPRDISFPGQISVEIDATDVKRRIFHIHEEVPVQGTRSLTLLFPQWMPGDHSPDGALEKLASLIIFDRGQRVRWVRDEVSVYAFHMDVPAGATKLDVNFDYFSSTGSATGPVLIQPNMFDLQWQSMILYPAGYFSRDIQFVPTVKLLPEWNFYSSLDGAKRTGDVVRFSPVDLESLVDSPVMAGRYLRQVVLATKPVRMVLDVAATSPEGLARLPEAAASFKLLQDETIKLFGAIHYQHYDHMLWLGDGFGQVYYEHHQSGENSGPADLLRAGSGPVPDLSFIEHGFVHSWNGMYQRPATMWTENLNTPERNSLFWVFEGLTCYWADVLGARAGLATRQDTIDRFGVLAAYSSIENGAQWRSLEDVNNAPVYAFRKTEVWPAWQRSMFDAYTQGELIWLGVDTMIRKQTGGRRSLDDLARSFFGGENGALGTNTYTFADLIGALNRVCPFDWYSYLRDRLEEYGTSKSLDGIEAGGYKMTFADKETPKAEADGFLDLAFSLGMQIGSGGRILAVHLQGPAYQAGLIYGGTIVSVNGVPYEPMLLQKAVRVGGTIRLSVKRTDKAEDYDIAWQHGLRLPVMTRINDIPDLLGAILAH